MVKREVSAKQPTKARIIQAHVNEATAYHYPEEYKALGEALKQIGDETFVHQNVTYRFHYAGGHNHDSLSDIVSSWQCAHAVYDECDGKNWDSTMQEPVLTAEALVYSMVGARAALDVFVRNGLCKGKIRCKVFDALKTVSTLVYHTYMKRLSGDFNTSMGNTIISMIICFSVISGLPEHLRPTHVDALFMGDDYLARYAYLGEPPWIDLKKALDAGWASHGVTPERGLFADPLHVTFISLGVWPRRGGGLQLVPLLGKQLVKLFWTIRDGGPEKMAAIANGIAVAFWPTYYGHPLMQAFLKAHYTPDGVRTKWDHYFADMLTATERNVDWCTGTAYKYGLPLGAYNLEIPAVCRLRAHVLHHPAVDRLILVDSLGPHERPAAKA